METEQTQVAGRRLLMISTDRLIFKEGSAVRARQIEYAKKYDEVHIVIFDRRTKHGERSTEHASEISIAPNCWVYSTRSVSKLFYPLDALRLARFIAKNRHITEVTCQDASLTAIAGISIKKHFNVPLQIQIHEDIGSPYYTFRLINKIRKSLALSHVRQADSIRVVSNRIKAYLESLGIESSKISVQPITVDTEWIKNAPITIDLHKKYPQFEKIVLMASRLEAEKNIELAIKAWKEIVEKFPKAGLVIVGTGSLKGKLESRVQSLGLTSSVVFEGWVDTKTLASYYKTANIYLNTSFFEGYGMTFVEAQAAGCPIVSTDVGIAQEVGATIVSLDEKDVARGILEVLNK